jgi:hypothetical protein
VPMIAVDFGYSDVPVEELGPDRVISHFDQLMEACDALLAVADDPLTEPTDPGTSTIAPRGHCTRM